MFMKKSGTKAPTPADLSRGHGLFVARDEQGRTTEVVVDENAARSGRTGALDPAQVIDVEVNARPTPSAQADESRPAVSAGGLRIGPRPAAPASPVEQPPHPEEPGSSSGVGLRGLAARKVSSPGEVASEAKPAGGLSALLKKKSEKAPDAQPAVKKEKGAKGSGLGGWFSKGREQAPSQSANPVADEADAPKKSVGLKAWGSRKSDAATAEGQAPGTALGKKAAKPAKAAKPKATKHASKKAGGVSAGKGKPVGAADVLVELEDGARVFWRVTADSLSELDASQAHNAASFSAQDYAYGTDAALSYGQAYTLVLSERGEDCRIVNASKELGMVYGAHATRVAAIGVPMGPGSMLIERLMAQSPHEGNLIVGLMLSDAQSGRSVVVLMHRPAGGELSAPQVTLNPDDLTFTLTQFATSKHLNFEDAEVVLYRNADLLRVAGGLALYPAEAVWNNIPVRKLLWGVSLAGTGVAIACAAFAGQAFVRKQMLESERVSLTNQVRDIDGKLQQRIASSLESFSLTQAVPVAEVTERAASLWVPRSVVTLEATAVAQKYTVTMGLKAGNSSNNRPSVLTQVGETEVNPLINLSAPEGCSKEIPGVSGGVDAIQITIVCESAPRSVHRYRTD